MKKIILTVLALIVVTPTWAALTVNNVPKTKTGGTAPAMQDSSISNPSSGNVGVGSTNPGTKLDVNGTVRATAFSGDGSAITGLTPSQWVTTGSNIYFTGGNVGVGSTNPGTAIDVSGDIRTSGAITAGGSTSQFQMTENASSPSTPASGLGYLYEKTDNNFYVMNDAGTETAIGSSQWTTNGNDIFYNNATGLVGIGTSAPTTALTVSSAPGTSLSTAVTVNNRNGRNYGLLSLGSGSATSPNGFLIMDVTSSSAKRMLIDANGNVGIGTTVVNNGHLQLPANGSAAGQAVCWGTNNCLGYCTAGSYPACSTCTCF